MVLFKRMLGASWFRRAAGVLLAVVVAAISVTCRYGGLATGTRPADAANLPPPPLVEVARAHEQAWSSARAVVGMVKSDQHIDVTPVAGGRLVSILPTGTRVRRGEALYRTDDAALRGTLAGKQAALEHAVNDARRAHALVDQTVTKADRETADTDVKKLRADIEFLHAQLNDLTLIAPFDGVVGYHNLHVGQVISSGQVLFSYQNPKRRFAEFTVVDDDAGFVAPGTPVVLAPMGVAARSPVASVVTLQSPETSSSAREVTQRALVPATLNILPGSAIRVCYHNSLPGVRIVVPLSAVQFSPYGQSVFVIQKRTAILRSVVVTQHDARLAVIDSGLHAGEMVVTDGYQRLYSGSPVRLPPAPPADGHGTPASPSAPSGAGNTNGTVDSCA